MARLLGAKDTGNKVGTKGIDTASWRIGFGRPTCAEVVNLAQRQFSVVTAVDIDSAGRTTLGMAFFDQNSIAIGYRGF